MKALFVSLYPDTPHFETELELMSDLLAEGFDLHVLRCHGRLGSCTSNPLHKSAACTACVSKIDNGLRSLGRTRVTTEEMPRVALDPRLPREFADGEELKAFTLDGANLGRGVYSTICSRINKDTRPDTRRYAAQIRTELEAAYTVFMAVKDAIRRTRPDRVYVFNGRFTVCYPVILASELAGVDYFTHERGGTTDRYLVRKNALPHDIAFNQAEIEAMWLAGGDEAAARQCYHDRRNGLEQSWASFTKEQTVGRLPDGFDSSKRNIAIFNSTLEEYAAIKGWECKLYPDEVVGLRRVVESLQDDPTVHIYLRVHPHLKDIPRDENYQLREYGKLSAKNLTIIWPESRVHTYALLDHCNVTMTFGSTVGVEACFWGKPSVLAGRALYEGLGCAYEPKDHDELVAQLRADLPSLPVLGALKYGYWETVRGTKFRRFKPTGLNTGEWQGRPCRPTLRARLQSVFLNALGR